MQKTQAQKNLADIKQKSEIILKNSIILYSCFAIITGLLGGIAKVKNFDSLQAIQGLILAILCYRWCVEDAKERHLYPIGRMAIWSAIFPPFGIPYYLIKTRSKRDSIVVMCKIAICVISYQLIIIIIFVISTVFINYINETPNTL